MLFANLRACSFVMAVRKDGPSNRAPVYLRSYTNPNDPSLIPDVKVWEAARATSAAPTYFQSMDIRGSRCEQSDRVVRDLFSRTEAKLTLTQ